MTTDLIDAADASDTPVLPDAQVLMGATFALMSSWATPSAEDGCTRCRALIARKVVSNLFFLIHHPQVGDGLSRLLSTCHERWQRISAEALQQADVAHALAEQPPRDAMH
ncbi:MAG: hypothetical protein RL654_2142 [Pseudomonadota bacterium]|jgi:hypothetical protein